MPLDNPSDIDPLGDQLHELASSLTPSDATREDVKRKMFRRIRSADSIAGARSALQPDPGMKERVWRSVSARITSPIPASLWDKVRDAASPQPSLRPSLATLRTRLTPAVRDGLGIRLLRLFAVTAALLLTARAAFLTVLPPHTVADSPVLLLPSQGEVSVLMGGLWERVPGEITLKKSVVIQTGSDGSATVIVHDNGVLRLGPGTTVAIQDVSDRPDPSLNLPTFAFEGGTLWVQSLIPEAATPGWSITTPYGRVSLNEGSISLQGGDQGVTVEVWDRLARAFDGRREITLVAGEKTFLTSSAAVVRKTDPSEEENAWVAENLKRDAVHRHEIALLQQERRVQNAGILPTSTLYPVKRVAEAVDVLLTFGDDAKTQKLLDQANTRLNEAAALLASGSGADAAQPLAEYKQLLLAVATGTGRDVDVRSLVQEQVASEVADVSAALPGDRGYLIKQTVLETSAALPQSSLKPEDVQGSVLVDTLVALTQRAQNGDASGAVLAFKSLVPTLSLTDATSPLPADVRKEAKAALSQFVQTLRQDQSTGTGVIIGSDLLQYLPGLAPAKAAMRSLTDAEIDTLVQQMYNRIFLFKQPRSRYDQLLSEFHSLEGNPDRGRILRRLYHALPANGLAQYVRTEIQQVREEVEGKTM
jgi:hypothetical protein